MTSSHTKPQINEVPGNTTSKCKIITKWKNKIKQQQRQQHRTSKKKQSQQDLRDAMDEIGPALFAMTCEQGVDPRREDHERSMPIMALIIVKRDHNATGSRNPSHIHPKHRDERKAI